MYDIYVVAGPTASGKTAVAVELAKEVGGEVISADSMQVYKQMDIGTAKPTEEEKKGIPHHLIDVCCPNEPFSVAWYKKLADRAIADVLLRGKTPILAGGTGFYINAVLYDAEFSEVPQAEADKLRSQFLHEASLHGEAFLHNKLQEVDPDSAKQIHQNNVQRVSTALAFFYLTSEMFSVHNKRQKSKPLKWKTGFFMLEHPRAELYERINKRAIKMFEVGFIYEVRNLLYKGYGETKPMQGIGYKEATLYLNNQCTYDEMILSMQQATRNYAKRQITWFKNQVPWANKVHASNKTAKQIVEWLVNCKY